MTAKTNFTTIESLIEERIAKLSEDYDLDRFDIADIRLEAYKENGWGYDPFPIEDDEEEEAEEESTGYRDIYDELRDLGMSMRDFF